VDVIGSPADLEGGLFSEINDNSVAILLTYGTARILLAGDAEANEEEYMANGPYTGPLTMLRGSVYEPLAMCPPWSRRHSRAGRR
jgi:competence protein ComEC